MYVFKIKVSGKRLKMQDMSFFCLMVARWLPQGQVSKVSMTKFLGRRLFFSWDDSYQ